MPAGEDGLEAVAQAPPPLIRNRIRHQEEAGDAEDRREHRPGAQAVGHAEIPRYRTTIQKPASVDHRQAEATESDGDGDERDLEGRVPAVGDRLASRLAVVTIATVAEPCAARRMSVSRKPKRMSGTPTPSRVVASALPIPLGLQHGDRRLHRRRPRAGSRRSAGGRADSKTSLVRLSPQPRRTGSAKKAMPTATSSAKTGVPTKTAEVVAGGLSRKGQREHRADHDLNDRDGDQCHDHAACAALGRARSRACRSLEMIVSVVPNSGAGRRPGVLDLVHAPIR